MNNCIWVSHALGAAANNAGFITDLLRKDRQFAFDCESKNRSGEALNTDCFPKKGSLLPEDANRTKLPQFGVCGSFVYMSEQCAEIFWQFDLGEGGLYPIDLYQADEETRLSGNWYCLNFGNVKEGFCPDQSTKFRPISRGKYKPKPTFADGDLAFKNNVLDGPDIWIDPLLFLSFCMSNQLVSALQQAGLTRCFDPIRRASIAT